MSLNIKSIVSRVLIVIAFLTVLYHATGVPPAQATALPARSVTPVLDDQAILIEL
jgi:hypothetical protein